ncbi:MAG: thioredoxin domain-containing protein, partial [Nanoarchaeota archaeon]
MEDTQETQKSEGKVSLEFTKTTLWQIISGVLAVVLVVSIITNGFSFNGNGVTGGTVRNNDQGNSPQAPSLPTGPVDVSADDDPALGDKNAPVLIIEFSDFQCPFCSRFREQTFDQIKTNYIDTGKVRFVYRDFPLSSI